MIGFHRLRRHARPVAWATLDQVLSSLSNAIISVAVARRGGAGTLGSYSVTFATYLVVLGFERALFTEPLLVVPNNETTTDRAEKSTLSMTTAYLVLCAGAVGLAGWALHRTELIVLAAALPLLGLQDFGRYLAFRRRAPLLAVTLDGIWVLAAGLAFIIWPLTSATRAVVAWGMGGALGALPVLIFSKPTRLGPAFRSWKRESSHLGISLAGEGVAYTLGSQAFVFLTAAVLGASDLGRIRAAQMLLAPISLAVPAIALFAMPRLAAMSAPKTIVKASVAIAVASSGVVLLATVGVTLATGPAARLVFSNALPVPAILVAGAGTAVAFSAAGMGLATGLKAMRLGRALVTARVSSGVLGLLALTPGLIMQSATTVMGGLVVQSAFHLVLTGRRLAQALERPLIC